MPKKRNAIDAESAAHLGSALSRLPVSAPAGRLDHDPSFITQSLKWLCDDAFWMRFYAESDDIKSFLRHFKQLRLQVRELEPAVSGLRHSWAAVCVGVLGVAVEHSGRSVSSVHLYFYQRCREVLFTVWAAAEYDKLKASVEDGEPVEFDTIAVRRRWSYVRDAVMMIDGFDLHDHDKLDAELGALMALRRNAPKDDANNANNSDIFPGGVPSNPKLVMLINRLVEESKKPEEERTSERRIALEIAGQNKGQAESLKAQKRKLVNAGKVII